MSDTGASPIYPIYCNHLSKTLHQFCPLRTADIHRITTNPVFQAQNLYHFDNHPIRWVRVVGIVVAFDEYGTRKVLTIDDSSGACIECHVNASRHETGTDDAKENAQNQQAAAAQGEATKSTTVQLPDDVDIGSVLDIKGGLTQYRDSLQISIEKVVVLRSTEHEVTFWEKTRRFKEDVLSQPWQLTEDRVEQCRIEEEAWQKEERKAVRQEKHRRRKAEKKKAEAVDEPEKRAISPPKSRKERPRKPEATGVSVRRRVAAPLKKTYSALGINTT